MSKVGNYPIPFDSKGNQQHYAGSTWSAALHSYQPEEWKDNFVFTDVLTYDAMHSGRSAKYLEFTRIGGASVTMFIKDFTQMMLETTIKNGVVSGQFTFTKRGQNYGCRYVGPI